MKFTTSQLAVLAASLQQAAAFPTADLAGLELERRNQLSENLGLGRYVPPGPDDSRGPCPGLNTLANHNLIPHNGKNITSNQIRDAFAKGFGINTDADDTQSGIGLALSNYGVVCEYIKGSSCVQLDGTFLYTNLTILGEPHTFEHDHSYSRQDYKEKYANGDITNNISFNMTEFQSGLDVVDYKITNPPQPAIANFKDFNKIRLQREAIQNNADYMHWFQQNVPTMLFETGFIFGATFDRYSNGTQIGENPTPRLDWWSFWFSEESFPVHLGWVPAKTDHFNLSFITSVSKAVLAATVVHTPSGLPAGATASTFPNAGPLPPTDPSPTYQLFSVSPYRAATSPGDIASETATTTILEKGKNYNRRADSIATPTSVASAVLTQIDIAVSATPALASSASAIVGAPPMLYDFYQQSLDVSSVVNQVAAVQSYTSAVVDVLASMVTAAPSA